MQSHPIRLLALVAGSVLLIILPSARPAHAGAPVSGGPTSLVLLPPQLTSASQSEEVLSPGGTAQLEVQATDPQGSPLTFSWSASAGSLGTPVNGPNTSSQQWTAPACLAEGSAPVGVTVTNGLGLSTSALFDFSVVQDLGIDHQPPFTLAAFQTLVGAFITPEQTVRMNIPLGPISAERIMFQADHQLTVSFVYEYAAASNALGWMYYDDLVARGYVNPQDDTLRDANANGIADLHEDLYNLSPPSGPQSRPYIGLNRRCLRTFSSGGFTYSQPELALDASCTSAFAPSQSLEDARPGHAYELLNIDVVGRASTTTPGNGFSDTGLHPRIPNLLEPATAENNFKGVGKLVFLLGDDDSDTKTYQQLGTVADTSTTNNGIPDYDVSAYDAEGRRRSVNPDPGISAADRTVDLGLIEGGREIVFFLVSNFDSSHSLDNGTVYPCLRKAANGQCTLHLKTPISVFFSKSKWNLDQDPLGQVPVAARNIGCAYSDVCDPSNPVSSPDACYVGTTSQKLCGWMDGETLARLNTVDYGNTVLPMDAISVPASGNGSMPHAVLSTSSTTPGRWMLGFEDLPGGGDRDFNDIVFQLRSAMVGSVRSRAIAPAHPGCKISNVRFSKSDTAPGPCGPQVLASYDVATDCNVCDSSYCVVNPTPTWRRLALNPGLDTTTVDLSSTPGNQLCWRAQFVHDLNPFCQATLLNVDVGFQSVPATP
ncbi:DUF4114 domain-containing protein [Corallococcus sp. CA053C]|uniref:DUF4114 domain-containing protein n=1 Tax=Corallococcus sp. CA053C TaxID=2316732 RepID=UPI001F3142AB|nr:DUF4114 domain-containing protein [Corallococcus sp. CA053C]